MDGGNWRGCYAAGVALALSLGIVGNAYSVPIGDALPDLLGKPLQLTFLYTGTENTVVNTNQAPGKAEITFGPGAADSDGMSYITASPGSSSSETNFAGPVSVGDTFLASGTGTGGIFESVMSFDIYDNDLMTTLLQSGFYHTSASQPMYLGDQIGALTLVGYVGQDGSRFLPGYAVPEPTGLALMTLGLAGLAYHRRKKVKAAQNSL